MKNNIILTSGGFNNINPRGEDIKRLFEKISNGKKVLIVANAAPESSGNYISRKDVKENFEECGAAVDVLDIDNNNVSEILKYDVIYVIGGDPGELIELVNKTEFKRYVIEFLKAGVYIGESAGTMILGNNLKWVYDIKKGTKAKYDRHFDSYEGLGLTAHNVYPHYNGAKEDVKTKIDNYEKENNIKITRLNDGEFIIE